MRALLRSSEHQSSGYQSLQLLVPLGLAGLKSLQHPGSLESEDSSHFSPQVHLGLAGSSHFSPPGALGTGGTQSFQPPGTLGTGSAKMTGTGEPFESRGLGSTFLDVFGAFYKGTKQKYTTKNTFSSCLTLWLGTHEDSKVLFSPQAPLGLAGLKSFKPPGSLETWMRMDGNGTNLEQALRISLRNLRRRDHHLV